MATSTPAELWETPIELTEMTGTAEWLQGTDEREIRRLERADGGWHAWKLLTAAFVFEALLWGENQS